MRRRCLLIGLDGATFSIVDPLMDAGVMPFEASHVHAHPPLAAGPTQIPEPFPSPTLDEEAEGRVIARLKALGYLE